MKSRSKSTGPRPEADAEPVDGNFDVDERLLSVHDVALLASASVSGQLPLPTIRRFAATNRTDPRFSKHYEALAVLARDAGFDPVREQDLETALVCHRDFQRLLDTEGWEHPAEILDPDGDLGISCRELAHLAAAHADRAGDEDRAVTVRDKLQRAWAAQRERVAPVVSFVARLLEHDDVTAERLLQQASIEYKRQRRRTGRDEAAVEVSRSRKGT